MDLSFHALNQSGFLFNGSVAGGLYTGYMISLEAREDEEGGALCADLRLYHVVSADLGDAEAFSDPSARTLVGTYATSVVSMSEILYGGDTYQYRGYSLDGGTTILPGTPPAPTIPGVTSHAHINLYFAKNPVVTVEFRYILNNSVLKAPVDFPVTFPFRFTSIPVHRRIANILGEN